ncbi:unnamed protein product, partial [Symbiodinium microadriaticum]
EYHLEHGLPTGPTHAYNADYAEEYPDDYCTEDGYWYYDADWSELGQLTCDIGEAVIPNGVGQQEATTSQGFGGEATAEGFDDADPGRDTAIRAATRYLTTVVAIRYGGGFGTKPVSRPRAIPPAPTPPSSSSVPAEAIQAEVQRQLHGVLQQLQAFGERNEQLQMELQEARMQLQLEQRRNANQEYTMIQPTGLLGDLGSASIDPGALAGLPPVAPFRESQLDAIHQDEQTQDGGPEIQFQPRHQMPPEPGGNADRTGPCGGWSYEHARPERAQEERDLPKTTTEGPGMLRSWWENRGRSPTPPPTTAKAGSVESPVLEALARGVQQLQELQMQALSKPATAAQEQVKPGTMSLTAMPDSSSATDSALSFQDWLEVSSSIMSDISESSATWWQGVLNAVEQTYRKWLAASPIEKLAIEPTATEQWCSGRWLRVNARGSSMLLGAMPNDLRADMVSRRCTQDCVRMLYRLYTHYQPGGSAERSEVLRRLQSPGDAPGSDTLEGVVKVLRAWPRWLERCRAVQMSPPDPSVLSRGLQALTSRHIEGSPDANFRTSMLRATLRLDARPSLDQVVGYHKHLQAELELLLGAKGAVPATTPQAKLRAVDPQLPPKARDAGGGKQGSAQELCRYRSTKGWSSSQARKWRKPYIYSVNYGYAGYNNRQNLWVFSWREITNWLCELQSQELEALALIARLEDRKLDLLNNEVLATEEKVSVAAMAMEKHWTHYLYDYVMTGSFESGLRAVRDAPFFEDIPGECLSNLIPSAGLWSGWDILKQIGWLSRPQRRKVLTSKRWVVHLFAGKEGHWEFMKLDQGDTTVLELDLARNCGQDIMRNEVWRMLLWGAKEGKVDVVFGGPPGRSQQNLKGGLRDTKSLTLVARMMWLYVVAQVGREVNGGGVNKNRDVGFVMEYPEGLTPEEKVNRELQVHRAEGRPRVVAGRGGVASWDHTRQFWDDVQRPRWEEWVGTCTVDASRSFWDTRMWKMFSREVDLHEVSFDQGAMGSKARTRTTLGTNIYSLLSLNEVRVPESEVLPERCEGDHIWSPGLVNAMVVAMSPLTPGLDSTSKGTMGKNLKYLLVAKYLVPKAFVEEFSGRASPSDNGAPEPKVEEESKHGENYRELVPDEQEDLFGDLFVDDPKDKRIVQAAEVVVFPDNEDLLEARALDIEEEYVPSEPEHEEEGTAEVLEPDEVQQQPGDVTMQEGDCVAPECTYLTFAVALPNNQSRTIRGGLQDIILYLKMHGLPVYRFHADKGEFYNNLFRAWLREQGVVGTWSEPSMPQSNGHAESTVKWIKGRARTLLQAAKLPVRLWPVAAATAAAEQRARVLGWHSCLAAPFGATVHLRKKAFDKYGPLRREHGVESKWTTGRYVGMSTIVHRGHVVYIPAEGEEKEKFLHTLHVRPNLVVDPGLPEEELRVEVPKPKRRIVTKTGPELVEMRAATLMTDEAKVVANTLAEKVLADWSWDKATQLIYDLAQVEFFSTRKFGVYRHGGAIGWLSGLVDYPSISKLLVRYVTDTNPEATFTSLLVSYNAPKEMHRDTNNDSHTMNYVIPVVSPTHGGELWIELKAGDVVRGRIEQRQVGKQLLYGQLEQLVIGKCIAFNPRRYHEVQDWEGTRVNIIAYTPDCLGKLSQDDLERLHDHGFPVPLTQLPEYHGNPQTEDTLPLALQTVLVDECEGEDETAWWSMYLDMSPGMVKIATEGESRVVQPMLSKAEVGYTLNIEKVIAELSGPLDVTHTVRTEEVTANIEVWRPAIMKELQSIECAIVKLYPGSDERRMWFNKRGVQRLPMKFVFTIKPNSGAVLEDPSTWYKRKARLVICGNMATDEGNPLYTETAPAEVVRSALTISTKKGWSVAILDVVAAFIKTPLGRTPTDPIVVAQPPRLLEVLGVVVKFELWGLIRALYGLREAPMLWGNYRDDVLKAMPLPRGLSWRQGQAITAWWTIRGSDGDVQAIVVVYVDDVMICGPRQLVEEIGRTIQQSWETSDLSFLGPQNSIRFLGMELQRVDETANEIRVFQQGYISELLRAHGIKDTKLDKVPITKDLAILPESAEPADPVVIRQAQRVTGEALWVTQRTRPDLAYTTSMMAALATKCPTQAVAISGKVFGYLRRTIEYGMTIKWNGEGLVMYSDAAYAPQGGRSHGGWLVTYGGVPLAWRSSRQSMITLSTAEAELLALLDGAVAVKGIEAILNDAGEAVEWRKLASDSTSALSISAGGSSWRTRHLRIKAAWLQEQVADGYFEISHCPGIFYDYVQNLGTVFSGIIVYGKDPKSYKGPIDSNVFTYRAEEECRLGRASGCESCCEWCGLWIKDGYEVRSLGHPATCCTVNPRAADPVPIIVHPRASSC